MPTSDVHINKLNADVGYGQLAAQGNRQTPEAARCSILDSERDALRDLKTLWRYLTMEIPRRTLRALRHTSALEYIGSPDGEVRSQKMLGHTSPAQSGSMLKFVPRTYRIHKNTSACLIVSVNR
jgi:hypothetical protein